MLTRFIFGFGILILLSLRAPAPDEKKDQDLIQGSWKVVKFEHDGKVNKGPFREGIWVFKGKEVTLRDERDKEWFKGTFALDQDKKPRTIEITWSDGERKDKTEYGIYRIEQDTLMLCQGDERPKEFSGAGEAGLLHFERPAWKKELREKYGLKDGEVLRRIASPFPDCRAEYLKSLQKEYFNDRDLSDKVFTYRWDGKDIEFWGMYGRQGNQESAGIPLMVLLENGIPRQEIEVPQQLRYEHIEGEFVLRSGTTPEQFVPALQKILREELKSPIRLKLELVEREVIVANGKYKSTPLKDREADQVDLFAVDRNESAEAGGGSGAFDAFLQNVGSYIGKRIVNEVSETPKQRIAWYFHNSTRVLPGPDPNQDADGVLKNITKQTGLEFKEAQRKVQVLIVTAEKE
jgi:uncharacterized protein (TIGR03067 family)